jgi:hypothetical protein
MQKPYSYACKDYPGMEKCPGRFYAETEGETLEADRTARFGRSW